MSKSIRHRAQLSLEALEDRVVPASLTVTSAADSLAAGTLRSAVNQANLDAAKGISDSISFAANLNGSHIFLSLGRLEVESRHRGAEVDIWGSGIALNGDGTNILQIDSGAKAYLNGLTLAGGTRSTATAAPSTMPAR